MEQLLTAAEPAIVCASERLIELVDRVLNRDHRTLGPKNHAVHFPSVGSQDSCADYDGCRAS